MGDQINANKTLHTSAINIQNMSLLDHYNNVRSYEL